MFAFFIQIMSLFASFSLQSNHSEMNKRPKPAFAERPGLGFVFHGKELLSSALLISIEIHTRNTLKDTKVPAVPATRSGQDHVFCGIRLGPDPDGWET